MITARAKGVSEPGLLFKYPVRIAINPIISTIGWILPGIVSGETITAIVLSLPTTGPLLYRALISQDTYLAGSTVMFLTFLTVIGTLLSDIHAGVGRPSHPLREQGGLKRCRCERGSSEIDIQEREFVASQWQLMWRKLRKHKLALSGGGFSAGVLRRRALLRVLCTLRHRHPPSRLYVRAPAVGALLRRRRPVSPASVRVRPDAGARSGHAALEVPGRRDGAPLDPLIRTRRRLQAVEPVPLRPALVRGARRCRVPVRHRQAGPGRVLAGGVCVAHIAHHRPGGGDDQLRPRLHPGRHLGLLRRHHRRGDSAHRGVSDLDSDHPAVDGAERGAAAAVAADTGLLRHHDHPLHRRLDRPGAGGARPAAGVARGGLRDGGEDQRPPARRLSSAATCCRRS